MARFPRVACTVFLAVLLVVVVHGRQPVTAAGRGGNSTSGNSTSGNGTSPCSSLYSSEAACLSNASCTWDFAAAVCVSSASAANCTFFVAEMPCVADAACVWDPVTLECYTNPNATSNNVTTNCTTNGTSVSTSGNVTCGNGTTNGTVNGTTLRGVRNNTTANNGTVNGTLRSVFIGNTSGNSTSGNSTSSNTTTRNASHHAAPSKCRDVRVHHRCSALVGACYWDAIGSVCRDAVVASERRGVVVSRASDEPSPSAPGSGVAVAAAACGALLLVASAVGVAVLRVRRARRAADVERVPILHAEEA